MYIIAVYDISTLTKEGRKGIQKSLKVMRRYLHHTQKSVFEGELTEAKYRELKFELKPWINAESDQVVFFRVDKAKTVQRETMGKDFDPTDVFL